MRRRLDKLRFCDIMVPKTLRTTIERKDVAVVGVRKLEKGERERLSTLDANVKGMEFILPRTPQWFNEYVLYVTELDRFKFDLIEKYDLDIEDGIYIWFDTTAGYIISEDY